MWMGCKLAKQHFTLDKSNTTIRDHSLSATPKEFKLLVDLGKDIFKKVDTRQTPTNALERAKKNVEEGRKKKDLLTMLGPRTASYALYRFSVLAQSSTEMP